MKKSYFKPVIVFAIVLLTIIIFLQGSFLGSIVHADDDSTGGLVPCNNKCTLCHILVGLQNIFKYLMGLLFVATMFFITLNGALMMVSAGSKKILEQVKTALNYCLKGFLLFLICWVIITGIMKTLGYKQLNNWWQFECDTTQTVAPTTTTTPSPTGTGSGSKSGSYQPSGNLDPKVQAVLKNYKDMDGMAYGAPFPPGTPLANKGETTNCGSTCRQSWMLEGLPDFWNVKRSVWDRDPNSLKPGDICVLVQNDLSKKDRYPHAFIVLDEYGMTSTANEKNGIGFSKNGLEYNIKRANENNLHIEVAHIADYIK